jgi:chondroitin AC lyase
MLDLARAYKKQGSPFYGDAATKKTVTAALDFWLARNFICENWWWNEMGTPNWMINTLLVLDTDLTEKQRSEGSRIAARASLTGVGARAGGDFVPIAGMVCKQGLFKGNDSILQNAIKVMVAQIEITPARGINPDM